MPGDHLALALDPCSALCNQMLKQSEGLDVLREGVFLSDKELEQGFLLLGLVGCEQFMLDPKNVAVLWPPFGEHSYSFLAQEFGSTLA